MTEEDRAVLNIAKSVDADGLRTIIKNARGKSDRVERAAFERLIDVSAGKEASEPLARDLWKMIFAVEELRRLSGRKVWRMNRLRPKLEVEGAASVLSYCALNRTDGFDEVLGYGRADLLAESIVLRHPSEFSDDVLEAARNRLSEAGLVAEPPSDG